LIEEAIQKLVKGKNLFFSRGNRGKYERKDTTYKKLYPSVRKINSEL